MVAEQTNNSSKPQTPQSHWHFHLPGWAWVSILIVIAFGVGYYAWSSSLDEPADSDYEACIQVITSARNPETSEVREFSTPCDVPEGWEVVEPEPTDETADWQTYRNEEYGFEFRYPQNLILTEERSNLVSIIDEDDIGFETALPGVWIRMHENPDNFNLDEWCRDELYRDSSRNPQDIPLICQYLDDSLDQSQYEIQEFTVSEHAAIKIREKIEITQSIGVTEVTLGSDRYILEISGFFAGETWIDQILSTFRFIEPTSHTAGWQTYRNEELGFEFQYPEKDAIGNLIVIRKGNIVYLLHDNQENLKSEIDQKFASGTTDSERAFGIAWAMISQSVSSDSDIDQFIKEHYGSGCKLGEKNKIGNTDSYEIDFGAETSFGFDEGECSINYMTILLFDESSQKLVQWDIGQDINFYFDDQPEYDLDHAIVDTFRFIN